MLKNMSVTTKNKAKQNLVHIPWDALYIYIYFQWPDDISHNSYWDLNRIDSQVIAKFRKFW